jgi:AbrB family looped-hinge helix DNA binding protein
MDTHLSVKGQVVIPAELRRKYRLEPGTLLRVEDTGDGILLKPVTEQSVLNLEGILKGKGGLKALREDRARDAARENQV